MVGSRTLLRLEIALALIGAALALLSILDRAWIEGVARVEPDGGDGSFEWAVTAVPACLAVAAAVAARLEWRELRRPAHAAE